LRGNRGVGSREQGVNKINMPTAIFSRIIKTELTDSQSNTEGGIYQFHFGIRKRANVISQHGFRDTDQIVTEYSAVVFKPIIDTNFNLSGEAVIISVDRGANDRGETLLYKGLPGNNQKNPMFLWVVFRTPINTVQIAPFHESPSSKIGIWYNNTSSASALSSSAWRRKSSISRSSDILSLTADAGVKVRITDPAGISGGTSMVSRRLAGISTVCVTLIG